MAIRFSSLFLQTNEHMVIRLKIRNADAKFRCFDMSFQSIPFSCEANSSSSSSKFIGDKEDIAFAFS